MTFWRTLVLTFNLVGLRLGGAAIGLASQILLARLLSQNDVGEVFLGMSAAAFLSLALAGGYPQLAITCLPRYHALARKNLVRTFHGASLHDGARISVFIFAVAAIVYFWLPISDSMKTALLFGCISAPPSAFIRLNSSAANSVRRYGMSYVPDLFYRPGLFFGYLVVAWLFGLHLNVVEVLWAFVIANTVIAIGQAVAMGRDGTIAGLNWPDRHKLASHLRGRAAALVLVGLVATSFADIVTLLAGLFLVPADVALVGVAVRLAALAGFVTQATQQFVIPDLTAAMTRGSSADVRALLLRVNYFSLGAIFACVIGVVLFGGVALHIFGPAYEAARWPLALFMLSQAFRAASGMNQYLLSIAGFQIKTAGTCALAMIVLVAASTILTPNHGVLGLAVAAIIADAFWAALLALQAKRLTGRRGDIIGALLLPGA